MTTYAELQEKIAALQSQAEELRKRELAEIIADGTYETISKKYFPFKLMGE